MALVACLTGPTVAWAGLYKCSVDGKAVYQEQPCRNDQGTQSVLPIETARPRAAPPVAATHAAPGANARMPTPPPASPKPMAPAAAERSGSLDAAGREDFGRRAFTALASGNVAAYKLMLCQESLRNYMAPGLERVLDDFSHRIRVDEAQLTDVAGRKGDHVYFNATTVPDRRTGQREPYSFVYSVEVRQERDGKPCTRGLGVTPRRSAW